MSLRELILNTKPKLVPVECPAWDCTIYVDGSLPVADRLRIARVTSSEDDISIPLVIIAARDEAGERLFTEEDTALLATKDGRTLQTIALEVLKANGWTPEATEDARKNSSASPS